MENYPISPDDCLILLAIEESSSLREAARTLACDPTGLQRKVQGLASEHGVFQKIQGKWELTPSGRALLGWTRESILSQKKLLQSESIMRIATTTWFAERVLIPKISDLTPKMKDWSRVHIEIPQGDFEKCLLEAKSDYVVVCHPPENPLIAHKQIAKEPWSVVISRSLLSKKIKGKIQLEDLVNIPCILHKDINPHALLPGLELKRDAIFSANSLIAVRAGLVAGQGWGVVPTLLVQREIGDRELIELEMPLLMDRKICVWWLRSAKQTGRYAQVLCQWLQSSL
jgi:DNA-binding transcriptional LysR family regulator